MSPLSILEYLSGRSRARVREKLLRRQNLLYLHQLNWNLFVAESIKSWAREFGDSGLNRWRVLPGRYGAQTVQINIHSNALFIRANSKGDVEAEEPASLVYSLSYNGSIAVILSPHQSSHAKFPEKTYTIDLVDNPGELAGEMGKRRVNQHLQLFEQLSMESMTQSLPSKITAKLIARLRRKSNKFQNIFSTTQEARRNRYLQDANFAIGLVAGLVASTALPFARELGSEAKLLAAASRQSCIGAARFSECLESRGYFIDHAMSKALSTSSLLLTTMALVVGLLWFLRHNASQD